MIKSYYCLLARHRNDGREYGGSFERFLEATVDGRVDDDGWSC